MERLTFFLVVVGSCLKASSPGGSSLKYTTWAISARVLTLSVNVRLMTIGMILTLALRVPCVRRASLRGS